MKNLTINTAIKQTLRNIKMTLPMLFGIIFFMGLILQLIPNSFYSLLETKNIFGILIATGFGSVVAGTPVNSYVLGGEFLSKGVSFSVLAAFLAAWVTVGVIQFPAESSLLGKKFAIIRNSCAFISAIIIGFLTAILLGLWV